VTRPVRVGALLAGSIGGTGATCESTGRWLLVGSAGLWCADCLVPGCGWTTTTASSETATTAAVLHDLTHDAPTHTRSAL
jgi:hypothetical protein